MDNHNLYAHFSTIENISNVSLFHSHPTLWRPEYGSYMIEGTPGQPYGGTMSEFNTVQDNMRKRRQEAASVLKKNEAVCTVTSFPRLGSYFQAMLGKQCHLNGCEPNESSTA